MSTTRRKANNQQPVPPGRVVATLAGDVTLPDRFHAVRVATKDGAPVIFAASQMCAGCGQVEIDTPLRCRTGAGEPMLPNLCPMRCVRCGPA